METALHAPFTGRVKELLVRVGSQVETGAPLVRLEPTGDGRGRDGQRRPARRPRPACARRPRGRRRGLARSTTSDQPDPRLRRRGRPAPGAAGRAPGRSRDATAAGTLHAEMALLSLFTDFAELSRNRPGGRRAARRAAGAQLARALPHLPAQPRPRPRRAPGPLPRQAADGPRALRGHRSRAHARAGACGVPRVPRPAAAVRGRRGRRRPAALARRRPAGSAEDAAAVRALLERMVRATQRRFAAVGDLARSVRVRLVRPAARRRRTAYRSRWRRRRGRGADRPRRCRPRRARSTR